MAGSRSGAKVASRKKLKVIKRREVRKGRSDLEVGNTDNEDKKNDPE